MFDSTYQVDKNCRCDPFQTLVMDKLSLVQV